MLNHPRCHHRQLPSQRGRHVHLPGSTISRTLCLDTEVNARIAKAAAVMARLSKRVWQNSQLTENTKLRVYQACVFSTLLYTSDPWTAYALPSALSQTTPRISWQDKVTNSAVLQCADIPSMPSLGRVWRRVWRSEDVFYELRPP